MVGDERVRHCADCNLRVHNISALSREDAEQLLRASVGDRLCIRLFRRTDGTILTKDCPNGIAAARRRLLGVASRVAAAVGLAVLAGVAAKVAQDKTWGNYGWSMRLSNIAPVQWVTWRVQASLAQWFPRSWGAGGHLLGDIAGPPGPPPPTGDSSRGSFGPHQWEYRQ